VLKKVLIASLLFSVATYGDEFDDEFGDDEVIEIVQTKKKDDFVYYGSLAYETNYSYKQKYDEFSSSKLSLDLKLEYLLDDATKIKSNIKAYKDFHTNTNDTTDFNLNELSIEGKIKDNVDYKVGRQIVVWGKSDNIRITDILNPLDKTMVGMIDIKDLRLGRVMSKLDYYSGSWSFSGIVLHENRYSMMPTLGSDYYMPYSYPQEPNTELFSGVALSANASLEGQDISFYASHQYMDNSTSKSDMLGFAYNKVFGNYLFKTELAYFHNDITDAKTDALIGLEYNGIDEGSISFEVANKDDDIQYAIRFSQSYINNTLDFTALYSGFGKNLEDGGFARVWFDYDIDDEFSSSFGIITYQDGENLFWKNIKDNDKVFCNLKYNF